MSGAEEQAAREGAWSPGLESEIPRRLLPAVTLFRPENASLAYADVAELAELCGLSPPELAALGPERLVVHELLVRVTADLSVPDGPNYEDLGINLRAMVATLFERHVAPALPDIREAFDAELERAGAFIDRQLSERLYEEGGGTGTETGAGRKTDPRGGSGGERNERSLFARLFGGKARPKVSGNVAGKVTGGREAPTSPEERELRALESWRSQLDPCDSPLERACLEALLRTVGGIIGRRGRLYAERQVIRRIALVLIGNDRGAEVIAERLEPLVSRGIEREGYRTLPPQARPVIMNVKGASASGKSTIRPQQRQLAGKLDIPWEDFALISPDYWRKYLLDYDSLGEDFRYAAMLTGQELVIIDRKLDRYMAAKAARGEMSHLLIDRFRFDSFTLDQDRTADSRLLTRFGDRIYLFFMVTPPAETVERAWIRGIRTGRYKAVSDLLHHNVEAFTGMPALFLSWINAADKRVHVEFLDNDVPEGSLPRTAAFGWNDSLTILDVEVLLDIDRFRKVDIEARRPSEVFGTADLSAAENLGFIRHCAARIARIDFADRETARVYARVERGKLRWWDREYVDGPEASDSVRIALDALGRSAEDALDAHGEEVPSIDFARERHVTVGRWGEGATSPA